MKLKVLLAAAGILAMAGIAGAAPISAPTDLGATSLIEKVHGDHRDCRRDYDGWHRHNHYGERRSCHKGYGYEPRRRCVKDYHCVKTGPFGLEKRCFWRDLCN